VRELVINVMRDNSTQRITITDVANEKKSSDTKSSEKKEAAPKEKKPRKPRAPKEASKPICPLCKKGAIIKGHTAYGCSEYKTGCTFRLGFAEHGSELSDADLVKIIKKIS